MNKERVSILELERVMLDYDKTLEIHPDGTVTVEELVGPPQPLKLTTVADGATY